MASLVCLVSALPVRAAAPAADGDRDTVAPVILVPGLTGSKLRERASGRVLWGKGSNLLSRASSYALALPLVPGEAGQEIEAFEIIESISLAGLVRRQIYGPVLRLLEDAGYRRGRLDAPDPSALLYPFPYDWRQGVPEVARELEAALDRLRESRGVERLRVNLVCQSGGAAICRYFARFGGTAMDQVRIGDAAPPPDIEIDRMVLVGTGNGGGLRSLQMLNEGRSYIAVIGSKAQPEVLFGFPSLFQDLPSYRDDYFVGADGETLAVDLYDVANWEKYGWSVFAAPVGERLREHGRGDLLGDLTVQRDYLRRQLETARELQDLLRSDAVDYDPPRIYSIQNRQAETVDRALLESDGDGWATVFGDDKRLRRRPALAERLMAMGDGHATVASQAWLSPVEIEALERPPVYVSGKHFTLILDPVAKELLLEILGRPR